jgi:hypothetical protein
MTSIQSAELYYFADTRTKGPQYQEKMEEEEKNEEEEEKNEEERRRRGKRRRTRRNIEGRGYKGGEEGKYKD